MTAKWNDPAARKSFAARHQCHKKKNKPNGEFQYGGFVQRVDDSQKAKAHLNAKISPGGYLGNNSSSKPSDNRITNIPTLQDNGKTKLFRFMNSEQYGRQ